MTSEGALRQFRNDLARMRAQQDQERSEGREWMESLFSDIDDFRDYSSIAGSRTVYANCLVWVYDFEKIERPE